MHAMSETQRHLAVAIIGGTALVLAVNTPSNGPDARYSSAPMKCGVYGAGSNSRLGCNAAIPRRCLTGH